MSFLPPLSRRAWRAVATALLCLGLARAEEATVQAFDLPADDAANALRKFSAQSGRPVIAPSELVNHVRSAEVRGELTAQAALDRMLSGTALVAVADPASGSFAIIRRPVKSSRRVPVLNAAAVVVIGLAVDEDQSRRQHHDAEAARAALAERGIPAVSITVLPANRGPSPNREAILAALRGVKPSVDETWLVVLGQAAPGRNGALMFQVSGPRLSATDLAAAIAALPGKKFVVFGMAKSGGFLTPLLALPDVEAVSATTESGEINEPRFAGMWSAALAAKPDASFRELAADAAERVESFYRDNGLGQGEHAQLIDRASRKILDAPFSAEPAQAAEAAKL